MKTQLHFIFILNIFFITGLTAQSVYRAELIFPLQNKHVHSSSIIEADNGDLLTVWFHGSGERKESDVIIQGSRLKKGTNKWETPFLMADTPEIPDCNPVLFIDAKNRLRLFWIAVLAGHWENSLLRCRTALDYKGPGAPHWIWQDEIILKPGDGFVKALSDGYKALLPDIPALDADFGGHTTSAMEQLIKAAKDVEKRQKGWMTRTHALTLPGGRILLPLYSDGYYVGLMAIADDGGETWRASSPIAGALINQPSIVRKKNGTLVAYMREEGDFNKRVLISSSQDDGETWTPARYTDIPNPNSSLEIISLRGGNWVMVYNDTEEGRHSLAIALSDDEGKTWKWKRHLENKKGGAYHYPSVIQTKDGLIQITYTFNTGNKPGNSIKHVTINSNWITEGD